MLDDYRIDREPFYQASGNEIGLFEAAHHLRMPVMLRGPTGSGKTRFVEHMAWRMGLPLVTVACHEDMAAPDLVGRFLLDEKGTVWEDGPLARAVRHGGICYLDEVVEARQDTTVVIHPLTDDRRILPLDQKNELIRAHPDFQLVISYNPGYQSAAKDLKQSTRQRFAALDFDYPPRDVEIRIVMQEAGLSDDIARQLVTIGEKTRNLRGQGLSEGASTRLLVRAGRIHMRGIPLRDACDLVITQPLTEDRELRQALASTIEAVLW